MKVADSYWKFASKNFYIVLVRGIHSSMYTGQMNFFNHEIFSPKPKSLIIVPSGMGY